jgi:hypothetical protein
MTSVQLIARGYGTVRLAQREGYVRIFVDEGEPLAQLLRRAQE